MSLDLNVTTDDLAAQEKLIIAEEVNRLHASIFDAHDRIRCRVFANQNTALTPEVILDKLGTAAGSLVNLDTATVSFVNAIVPGSYSPEPLPPLTVDQDGRATLDEVSGE